MNKFTYRTKSKSLTRNGVLPSHLSDRNPSDEIFLRKVRSCIINHISDQHFGVDDLARTVHLSTSQLNRKLNLLISRPAGQFIRELRLSSAANYLAYSNETVGAIAAHSGFSDQAHFCRSFKKCFQSTPSRFRKLYQKENREDFFKSINARIWQIDARNVQALLH